MARKFLLKFVPVFFIGIITFWFIISPRYVINTDVPGDCVIFVLLSCFMRVNFANVQSIKKSFVFINFVFARLILLKLNSCNEKISEIFF